VRVLDRVCEKALLAEISPHTLRHYVACRTMSRTLTSSPIWAVNSGLPDMEASPITRHSFVDATDCPGS
jgi:integrase